MYLIDNYFKQNIFDYLKTRVNLSVVQSRQHRDVSWIYTEDPQHVVVEDALRVTKGTSIEPYQEDFPSTYSLTLMRHHLGTRDWRDAVTEVNAAQSMMAYTHDVIWSRMLSSYITEKTGKRGLELAIFKTKDNKHILVMTNDETLGNTGINILVDSVVIRLVSLWCTAFAKPVHEQLYNALTNHSDTSEQISAIQSIIKDTPEYKAYLLEMQQFEQREQYLKFVELMQPSDDEFKIRLRDINDRIEDLQDALAQELTRLDAVHEEYAGFLTRGVTGAQELVDELMNHINKNRAENILDIEVGPHYIKFSVSTNGQLLVFDEDSAQRVYDNRDSYSGSVGNHPLYKAVMIDKTECMSLAGGFKFNLNKHNKVKNVEGVAPNKKHPMDVNNRHITSLNCFHTYKANMLEAARANNWVVVVELMVTAVATVNVNEPNTLSNMLSSYEGRKREYASN